VGGLEATYVTAVSDGKGDDIPESRLPVYILFYRVTVTRWSQ